MARELAHLAPRPQQRVPERHVVAQIEMSVDSLLRVVLYIMAAYDAGASASQRAFHKQVTLSNLSYQERKRES